VAALLLLPLASRAEEAGLPEGLYAEITTQRGVITCDLEYRRAPLTVTSFVGLAEGTLGPLPRKPFFDGLKFHRVVPDFVIQGGDPLGTGEGGPDYTFTDEFSPALSHDSKGVLSMANDGPDTNGSQFFITLAPENRLDFLYSVFGHVVRGGEVPSAIKEGDVMQVRILRIGAEAQNFEADDATFSDLDAKAAHFTAPKEPGPKSNFDDPDKLLPIDPPRGQYFNLKLANVERMTGKRIYVRVLAKFVPADPSDTPDAFTQRLATTLGLSNDGVLAVYFADTGKWSLSVGKSFAAHFAQMAGSSPNVTPAEALASGKAEFIQDTAARDAKYLAAAGPELTKILQTSGRRITLAVHAVVDELLAQLVKQ
jgi:cyclophilin family peptidyl-prolyl cis-trans isomerase